MPKPAAAIAEKGSRRRGCGWASGLVPCSPGLPGQGPRQPPSACLPSLSPRRGLARASLHPSVCICVVVPCPAAARLQRWSVPPPAPALGLRAPVAGGPQALGPPCPPRPGPRSSPAAPSAAQAISGGGGGPRNAGKVCWVCLRGCGGLKELAFPLFPFSFSSLSFLFFLFFFKWPLLL